MSVISRMKLLQLGDEREEAITDNDEALELQWRILPHHLRKEKENEEKTWRDKIVNSVFSYLGEWHSIAH